MTDLRGICSQAASQAAFQAASRDQRGQVGGLVDLVSRLVDGLVQLGSSNLVGRVVQ